MENNDNSKLGAADDRNIRSLTVDDVLFFVDALLLSRQQPQSGEVVAAFAKLQQIKKELIQGQPSTGAELQRLLDRAKELQGILGAPRPSLSDLTKVHSCHEMPAAESAEGEDELSPEIPLPKLDVSVGARISRGREKQQRKASALIESVLLAETGGGSRTEDMNEAARQVSPTAMKIAQKRMGIDNAERAARKRMEGAERSWRKNAREVAKQKRADDSFASIADVVRHIRDNSGSTDLPENDKALTRLVKAMEEDGTLPPKVAIHKKDRTSPR